MNRRRMAYETMLGPDSSLPRNNLVGTERFELSRSCSQGKWAPGYPTSRNLERRAEIESASPAWKAGARPIYQRRVERGAGVEPAVSTLARRALSLS